MKYKINSNSIQIFSKEDFCPQHILECGQIFAYEKIDGGYQVFSGDKSAKIFERDFGFEVQTSDPKYFENFFDLQTDYGKIKSMLQKFEIMKKPIEFGKGIRILKNNLFEVCVSFIISANNNIKRIQKIIKALKERCKSGTNFPSHKALSKLDEKDFVQCGLGYRAPQLYKALRQFDEDYLQSLSNLPTDQLRKKLLSFSGVGPKVADCILLFGYSKKDVFPVDTWIHQMYEKYYGHETSREKIRNRLVQTFKDLSGYAQQYLFYFQRSAQEN